MALVRDITTRDWFRKLWKQEHDPLAAYRAHVHSSITPLPEPQLPHLDLVTEPWDRTLEGLNSNQTADKPAHEQKMMAPAPQPAVMKPFDQQRLVEPYNNPFSTVPGGMGFGSMKPPGM